MRICDGAGFAVSLEVLARPPCEVTRVMSRLGE
jgi:hypothetical protein